RMRWSAAAVWWLVIGHSPLNYALGSSLGLHTGEPDRVGPPPAICKVDHESGDEPDHQSNPRLSGKTEHLRKADDSAEYRDGGHEGRAEWALEVRCRAAQHNDANAHEDEGEERPDAHELAEQSNRQQAGSEGDDRSGEDRAQVWRAEAGVDDAEERRQQTIAAHGVKDARLGEQLNEHRTEETEQRAHLDHGTEPLEARRVDAHGEGIGDVQTVIADDAEEYDRDGDVNDGADRERAEDADGHVALRVLRFLGGRRDGIEADVSKEHHPCAAQHAAPAELAKVAFVRRNERRQVLAVDVR